MADEQDKMMQTMVIKPGTRPAGYGEDARFDFVLSPSFRKETTFFGHSCIIDPWGEIVVEAGEEPLLLPASLDIDRVQRVRERIPVFADRRPQVYATMER